VDANDASAEVFTIAWRRVADAPGPDSHLPWLYGIPRSVVSETHHTDLDPALALQLLNEYAAFLEAE
jgi:RNA polymerase sigma-70 factor (ECF subfamily)